MMMNATPARTPLAYAAAAGAAIVLAACVPSFDEDGRTAVTDPAASAASAEAADPFLGYLGGLARVDTVFAPVEEDRVDWEEDDAEAVEPVG